MGTFKKLLRRPAVQVVLTALVVVIGYLTWPWSNQTPPVVDTTALTRQPPPAPHHQPPTPAARLHPARGWQSLADTGRCANSQSLFHGTEMLLTSGSLAKRSSQ